MNIRYDVLLVKQILPFKQIVYIYIKNVSEEILLLRSPPAPCGYAARANSDGAKLSFAFSLIDRYEVIR